jgi:hypothetical protein
VFKCENKIITDTMSDTSPAFTTLVQKTLAVLMTDFIDTNGMSTTEHQLKAFKMAFLGHIVSEVTTEVSSLKMSNLEYCAGTYSPLEQPNIKVTSDPLNRNGVIIGYDTK